MLKKIKEDLFKCAYPEKAKILSGYFKTCKGQYGEGDFFYGLLFRNREESQRSIRPFR
jgi:hypothetical protein